MINLVRGRKMSESPLTLVQLHILVPREIKDKVTSYVASHPEEFLSDTEFWIKSVKEELEHREFEDRFI